MSLYMILGILAFVIEGLVNFELKSDFFLLQKQTDRQASKTIFLVTSVKFQPKPDSVTHF